MSESPTLSPVDKLQQHDLATSSSERKPLAPPPKFKKAELNESLRSIISYDSHSSFSVAESLEVPRGKFLLEHEKEASDIDLLDKAKERLEINANNTISSNKHVYDSEDSVSEFSRNDDSPVPRRRDLSNPVSSDVDSPTPLFSSRNSTINTNNNNNNNNHNASFTNNNNNNNNTRSNSVSSIDSIGSSGDSLLSHHPLHPSSFSSSSSTSTSSKLKKKSLLAAIFFSKTGKSESADSPAVFPEELESKNPKSVISQHANFTSSDRKLYTRKPFQKVESFQSVKDKKYKTILEDQQQRVLTEVPRLLEYQLVEEAYPIILKMCQEYIKNLGEKHEITLTAIDKLKLMATFLGRECEFSDSTQ